VLRVSVSVDRLQESAFGGPHGRIINRRLPMMAVPAYDLGILLG
jgi:hypothetical protein